MCFFEIVVFLVLLGQMALVYDAWREVTFWRKADEICTLSQYEALPFVLLASAVASLLIYGLHFLRPVHVLMSVLLLVPFWVVPFGAMCEGY
jgi:hypothetical protein